MNWLAINLPLVVLIPFAGAALAAWAARFHRVAAAWTAGGVALLSLALLLPSAVDTFAGETLIQSWAWMPSIGLWFAFRLDGLALLFALLILVIGLLVILYARYYLSAKDSMGRFLPTC